MGQGYFLDKNETRRDDMPIKWSRNDKALEERKTILHETFWDDFTLLAKVCLLHDENATVYDVFDVMRTKILGGWEFSDEFAARIDAQIEAEENGLARVI